MTAARELLAAATPRPWSADDKGRYGAVASTDSAAIERFLERYPEHGASDVEAYGGALVGESIQASDRALIVAAVNEYEALLALEEYVRFPDASNETLAGDALARLDALREVTRDER